MDGTDGFSAGVGGSRPVMPIKPTLQCKIVRLIQMKRHGRIREPINGFLHNLLNVIRNLNIYRRLVLAFFILILIPNLVISLISFNKFSTEIETNISNYSIKSLSDLNLSITEQLKKYDDLSQRLSLNSELRELIRKCDALGSISEMSDAEKEEYDSSRQKIGEMLTAAGQTLSNILNLEILSDNEYPMSAKNWNKAAVKILDADVFKSSDNYQLAVKSDGLPVWFDTTRETGTYCMQSNSSTFIGGYLTVMRAIPEFGSDKPLGVIIMNISLNTVSDAFAFQDRFRDQESVVLVSGGGIISYLNNTFAAARLKKEGIREILQSGSGMSNIKISGETYLLTTIKQDYTGWKLSSIIPRESLIKGIYEIRALIVNIGLTCMLIALMLAYVVTLSISRPIKRLKDSMEVVDHNNLSVTYEDKMRDEVGVLGEKFNHMLGRIKNLIDTVYEVELGKKEEMILRKQAELDALQMQINPHFLYNTLDIIRWKVIALEKGESEASRMIDAFSDLIRMGTKKSSNLVKISEEIEHIKLYLEVIKFNTKINLEAGFDIQDERLLDCSITKLSLQPLIENAVVYGFAKNTGQARITIKVWQEENDILIAVTDNGRGIEESALEAIKKDIYSKDNPKGSIGLRNVDSRIKLNFGDEYGIEIDSVQETYTTVTVRIPREE